MGIDVYIQSFLKSALDGGEWLTSRPDGFTPRNGPGYLLDRRMGVPQSSEGSGEREMSCSYRDSNSPVRSVVATPTGLSQLRRD